MSLSPMSLDGPATSESGGLLEHERAFECVEGDVPRHRAEPCIPMPRLPRTQMSARGIGGTRSWPKPIVRMPNGMKIGCG